MKRYTLFLTFFCICLFCFLTSIYASSFHVTEDYEDSEVYVTTLFSIDSLPVDENEIYTIEYGLNSVIGLRTEALDEGLSWDEHITIVGDRYRRISGVNDIVRVPGNSNIGVFALVKNETGHEITLKDWMFFITRRNATMGDLRIFGVEGIFGYDYYNFFGRNVFKTGHYIPSPLVLNIKEDETKILRLASFKIFQPLKIEYFDWQPSILENGDLVVDVNLKLKNVASFRLPNIEYSHGDFIHTRTFSAEDEYIYEYQINYGNNYESGLNFLDSFEIKKPTSKTESIVFGSKDLLSFSGDTKSLLYRRSSVDGQEDWFASNVDVDWYPEGSAMSVTLLPYSLVGKPLEYYIPPEIEGSFLNNGEVLGIGDDLILEMEIRNSGLELSSLVVELNFDTDFQRVKDSDCDFLNFSEGIMFNTGVLSTDDVFFCTMVFEVLEKKHFLVLKNSLNFEDKILDSLVFEYIPDVEISFEYDYDLEKFVFESSFEDISSLVISENSRGGLKCQRISLLGLEDEVCI